MITCAKCKIELGKGGIVQDDGRLLCHACDSKDQIPIPKSIIQKFRPWIIGVGILALGFILGYAWTSYPPLENRLFNLGEEKEIQQYLQAGWTVKKINAGFVILEGHGEPPSLSRRK